MKEGIGMLFKKKTLDEKMEKYVKHHDWYAIQEVITGSKEEKIAAAKALGASDDQDRKSTRLNSSQKVQSRMPSSA